MPTAEPTSSRRVDGDRRHPRSWWPIAALALAFGLGAMACAGSDAELVTAAAGTDVTAGPAVATTDPGTTPTAALTAPVTSQDTGTVTVVVELEEGETTVVTRPVGCEAEPGAPTDLAAEPPLWLAFSEQLRWTDRAGCPVRIDVISYIHGPSHCDWETAEFLTIADPLGDPIAEPVDDSSPEDLVMKTTNRRFMWDPDGVLPGGPYDETVPFDDLPATAYDTSYRRDGAQLWLSDDPVALYRVIGTSAQVWHLDADQSVLCM